MNFTLKPLRPATRTQALFLASLLLLGFLVALLWSNDPAHLNPGKSRVGWPPAPATKP